MSRKLPFTPNSKIRQALRVLWLRSRERSQALKNTNYCCAYCGVKQSVAKGREVRLDVHHMNGIDWLGLCDLIRQRLLQSPEKLAPICENCHEKITEKQQKRNDANTPAPVPPVVRIPSQSALESAVEALDDFYCSQRGPQSFRDECHAVGEWLKTLYANAPLERLREKENA